MAVAGVIEVPRLLWAGEGAAPEGCGGHRAWTSGLVILSEAKDLAFCGGQQVLRFAQDDKV